MELHKRNVGNYKPNTRIMNIQGVEISTNVLSGVKTLAELKKSGLFAHLDTVRSDEAYKELWEALQPTKATNEKAEVK